MKSTHTNKIWLTSALLSVLICFTNASHFRGGLIYWNTLQPVSPNGTISVQITQRFAWRLSAEGCQTTGLNGQGEGSLYCRTGCQTGATFSDVGVYCTDFNTAEDWMVGERSYTVHSFGYVPQLEASFTGGNWISTLVIGRDSYWEVRVKFNFSSLISRRAVNSSPKTKMSPIINLLYGCNHTITIPVEDADGDDVRCRWASGTQRECAGVCDAFPGAVINERECKLYYNAINQVGLYAVALQIEDFYSPLDRIPLSSIPLQFLVNVYEATSSNATCYSKPVFVSPTRRNGACIGIPLNSTLAETIIAQSGGEGVSVVSITMQSPLGLTKSDLGVGPGSLNWHINITWTPGASQYGVSIFCFLATDSTGASSDQQCINLAVGAFPPAVKNGTMYPVGSVLPNNQLWQVEFDRPFTRPKLSAKIRFHDRLGNEVYAIDTATNVNVDFPADTANHLLTFKTTYIFTEKMQYYVTIENGIALGLDMCGPESVGISDPQFWRFTVKDITPPVLTFLSYPSVSNGSLAFVSWSLDEPAQCTCILTSSVSVRVSCNTSAVFSNLTEGQYTLFVQATDESGNGKQYFVSWYVDQSAPVVVINSKPKMITNNTVATFSMNCIDQSPCQLYCAVQTVGSTAVFQSCSSTYTSGSLTDGQYTFSAYGIDSVGNIGTSTTYVWTVDTIPPLISPVANVSILCGSPSDPSKTGIPTFTDNIDTSPKIAFTDAPVSGCKTERTWAVVDSAGNRARYVQIISFLSVIEPKIGGSTELYIPCGETAKLNSNDYILQALSITSPCSRQLSTSHTDSAPITNCGVTITRQWTIADDCGGLVYFTQTIHILFPSDPDSPANGEQNVNLNPYLVWPDYPRSTAYKLFLWQFGTTEPSQPLAVNLYSFQRGYKVQISLPPNTKMLWRVVYVVPGINGTTDIPGPLWGFQTQSFADLSVVSVAVPLTAFSGTSVKISWVVKNIGNVSTSMSSYAFTDAVYIGRSTNMADAVLSATVYQYLYVDPSDDGYTSTADVTLKPSDIGKFYIFVVVDVYRRIVDYSYVNNIQIAAQSIQVQLTPPPNLKVQRITIPGLVFSGQTASISFIIKNEGIGITMSDSWYDRLFLSTDDQLDNPGDLLLSTVYHNGVLASGVQYAVTVGARIPNAIFGTYFIIVQADAFNYVFENTDENDNVLSYSFLVYLSPYPDLNVISLSCPSVAFTGDNIEISAVVENSGLGAPFENYWLDGLLIQSRDGLVNIRATAQFSGGTQLLPRISYNVTFTLYVSMTFLSGNYSVTITAAINNGVFENNAKSNNNRTRNLLIIQQLPDLELRQSSITVKENLTGNYLLYSVLISNAGTADVQTQTKYWENTLILSSEGLATRLSDSTFVFSPLNKNTTLAVPDRTLYLPPDYYGTCTVFYSIDSRLQIVEFNEQNNYVQIGTVNISRRQADLSVKSLNVLSSAFAGSTITISWLVENKGNLETSSSASWLDEVTLTGNAYTQRLVSYFVSLDNPLKPTESYLKEANVTIPIYLAGIYTLSVTTGQRLLPPVFDDQSNNRLTASIILSSPPSPDLKPLSCSGEYFSATTYRTLSVYCNAVNNGNSMTSSVSWTDRIVLLTANGIPILDASVLASVSSLSHGEIYAISTTFVVSETIQGYYQLILVLDIFDDVKEILAEGNNELRVPSPVFIPAGPRPAFSISIDPLSQVTYVITSTLVIRSTIKNYGTADLTLSSWTDGLYLYPRAQASKQQIISSGLLIYMSIQSRQLRIGESYTVLFRGQIPYLATGRMYVYVVHDINDRLLSSNAGSVAYLNTSIMVEVGPLPDLVVHIALNDSIYLQSGQQFDATFDVTNNGNETASGIWYDSVYLSEDQFLDPFDVVLKTSRSPKQLESGSSYRQQIKVNIPFDLPGSAYYMIVVTNVRKDCFESTFNNNMQSKLLQIISLPAVDLIVQNVSSSQENVTYLDYVTYNWRVANNGSLAVNGYKCDSVYLSTDSVWDIYDVTVTDSPQCTSFSLNAKDSASDSASYLTTAAVPSVAAGGYKTIVRTRSNVRDFNLANNIGVSSSDISITPPNIRLNENKTFSFNTNKYATFQLSGITVGMAVTITLRTNYQYAYHRLYVKHNAPPQTNDYDVASKQSGTVKQTLSLTYAKTSSYYLLVESFSIIQLATYQLSITVKESVFEMTSVYPSTIAVGRPVTLQLNGNLFSANMRAYLNGARVQHQAQSVFSYSAEEAYATFDGIEGSFENFTLSLYNDDTAQSIHILNAVALDGTAIPGKVELRLLKQLGAVRAGNRAEMQIKVDNVGFSDVPMPIIFVQCGSNCKIISTLADKSVEPQSSVLFFPVEKNRPADILAPRTTSVIPFNVLPIDSNFVGSEPVYYGAFTDEQATLLLPLLKSEVKPQHIPADVWDIVWTNVEQCTGAEPSTAFKKVSKNLVQHYNFFFTVDDVIGQIIDAADGVLPPILMVASVDVQDNSYFNNFPLSIERNYYQQLTVRRTYGPFGRGWTSPLLDMRAVVSGASVLLNKERRQFIFTTDLSSQNFVSTRLPGDQIHINQSTIVYQSDDILYYFDAVTSLLKYVSDKDMEESVTIKYDAQNRPITLTHSSGNSSAQLQYDDNSGFIKMIQLITSASDPVKAYYSYSADGYLMTVNRLGSSVVYSYTANGDLSAVSKNSGSDTSFSYDQMLLLASTTSSVGDKVVQSVTMNQSCSGRVNVVLQPDNMSSTFEFGFNAEILQSIPAVGPPLNYIRDSSTSFVNIAVGDDIKYDQRIDSQLGLVSLTNANGDSIIVRVNDNDEILSVGDTSSPYYNFEYENGLFKNVRYRDGTTMNISLTQENQLSSVLLRDGTEVRVTYDDRERIRSIQYTEGTYIYSYNNVGLPEQVVSPDGKKTTLQYNADNLPTKISFPDGTELSYTYNSCKRRASVVCNSGYNCSYLYDDACRLTEVLDGSGMALALFQYEGNKLSQRKLANGMYTEYVYQQGSNRLQMLKNFASNHSLLSSYQYEYDKLGYRSQTSTLDGLWKFKYDAAGQLVEWESPFVGVSETLEYDSNLNRKSKTSASLKTLYQSNALNQYVSYGSKQNFTYDKNGNLAEKSISTGQATYKEQYQYNQEGRIVQIRTGSVTCNYVYDVFGSVSQKLCSDGTEVSYTVDPFGLFGGNILVRRVGNQKQFVYHADDYGLIGSTSLSNRNDLIFFFFDGDGSTRHTANSAGNIIQSYTYDPFGKPISPSKADDNTFRFSGQYGIESVVELNNVLFMRARLYDAEHGCFYQQDPAGIYGYPTNPYVYANNNPLTYVDPSGRLFFIPILGAGAIAGAAIGGALGGVSYSVGKWYRNEDWKLGDFITEVGAGGVAGAIGGGAGLVGSVLGSAGRNVIGRGITFIGGAVGSWTQTGINSGFVKTDPFTFDVLAGGILNFFPVRLIGWKYPKFPHPRMEKPTVRKLLTTKNKSTKTVWKTTAVGGLYGQAYELAKEVLKRLNEFFRWVSSHDPNDILGPEGYGDSQYVSAGTVFEYKIEFENEANATAPAQLVSIVCTLDNNFDMSTFKIGTFSFSDFKLEAGYNSFSYQGKIDSVQITGTYVDVSGGIDAEKSQARWVFQARDPSTGEPPGDALVGFLPPNNGTTGQGYVTFRINLKASTTHLAKITENATIYFDENPPIDTPTIFHTVDLSVPQVTIQAYRVAGGDVLFNFTAEDNGSGVKSIDLYNVNNGKPTLVISDITTSAVVVSPDKVGTGGFTAVVKDWVGNASPLNPQNVVKIEGNDIYGCSPICQVHGKCNSKGRCTCDPGYSGANCTVDIPNECEPPVLEAVAPDSAGNSSAVLFLSAKTTNKAAVLNFTILVKEFPAGSQFSKGLIHENVLYLSETEFGQIVFTTPITFNGLVALYVEAVMVSSCGTGTRSANLTTFIGYETGSTAMFESVTSTRPTQSGLTRTSASYEVSPCSTRTCSAITERPDIGKVTSSDVVKATSADTNVFDVSASMTSAKSVQSTTRGVTISSPNVPGRPSVSGVFPTFGPIAGGTRVTINGQSLVLNGSTSVVSLQSSLTVVINDVYVGDSAAKVDTLTSDVSKLIIITPPTTKTGSVPISLHLSDAKTVQAQSSFEYRANPVVDDIQPRNHLSVGGTAISVIGTNMDAVASPTLFLTIVITRYNKNLTVVSETINTKQTKCQPVDTTKIKCLMPPLDLPPDFVDPPGQAVATYISQNSSDRADVYLGIGFDGHTVYENITTTHPEIKMDFYPAPNISCPANSAWHYNPTTDYNITIPGNNLTRGSTVADVRVKIGDAVCEVVELTDTAIICRPPKVKPNTGNSSLLCTGDTLPVMVEIGYQSYSCNCIQYTNTAGTSTDMSLILAIAIPVAILLLIVVVILVFCRTRQISAKRRMQTKFASTRFETDQRWPQFNNRQIFARNQLAIRLR